MAVYDYKCNNCDTETEVHHPMSATPDVGCPKCATKMTRLIRPGGNPIFKGSGFYQNDYKGK